MLPKLYWGTVESLFAIMLSLKLFKEGVLTILISCFRLRLTYREFGNSSR
jgi:hypothetical protein